MRGVGDLTKAIDTTAKASDKAQDAYDDQGDAAQKAAAVATKAMAALGVKSEAVADKQIAAVKDAFDALKNSGKATEGELARAFESAERKIAAINRSIGRDTEKTFDGIGRTVAAKLRNLGPAFDRFGAGVRRGLAFGAAGGVAAGAAGVAAGVGVFNAVRGEAERADELIKLSRSTQTNVESLSAFAFAAEQSGVSTTAFATAFKGLRKSVEEADLPGKFVKQKDAAGKTIEVFVENASALRRLGIRTKEANGQFRSNDRVLRDVVQRLSLIGDETERATLASEIFGEKAGPELASFIELGGKGLDDYVKKAKSFGLTLTEETGGSAEAFNDNLDDISQRFKGLQAQFARPLFQPLADAFEKIGDVIDKNKGRIQEFGAAVGDGIVAVVKDLIAVVEGRAVDVQNSWILEALDGMKAFGAFVVDVVVPGVKAVGSFFSSLNPTVAKLLLALGLLSGPISIVIGLVTLLAGAIGGIPVLIGAAILAAGAAIYAYWDEIVGLIVGTLATIGDTVGGFFRGIVQGVFDLITGGIAFFGDMIGNFVRGIVEGVVGFFRGAFDQLVSDAKSVVDFLASYLPDFLTGGDISASVLPADIGLAGAMPAVAGAPVYLSLDGKSYPMSASTDVAAALTRDQNLKRTTRPTAAPRTFR